MEHRILAREPLLIAYWFQHDIARICERFPQVRLLKTAEDMQDWNAGKIPLGAIHPASAGHGLNLQAGGNQLVWFGLTWSLELYQQINARLWRQDQKAETVVIHHIVAADTIDEQILQAVGVCFCVNSDRSCGSDRDLFQTAAAFAPEALQPHPVCAVIIPGHR